MQSSPKFRWAALRAAHLNLGLPNHDKLLEFDFGKIQHKVLMTNSCFGGKLYMVDTVQVVDLNKRKIL